MEVDLEDDAIIDNEGEVGRAPMAVDEGALTGSTSGGTGSVLDAARPGTSSARSRPAPPVEFVTLPNEKGVKDRAADIEGKILARVATEHGLMVKGVAVKFAVEPAPDR